MAVKHTIPENYGTYFITFTCYKWNHLIELVNGYDIIYSWFDHLKSKGHYVNGYIIMPNHVHALLSFVNTGQSINTIIGNGKRFMAYEIINRLEQNNRNDILAYLSEGVEITRKKNKKKHEVWELSFDWKECLNIPFTWQKLDYMHNNPCVGKWSLSKDPIEYTHSSARFYNTGQQGLYPVTNFMEMYDIDFSKPK